RSRNVIGYVTGATVRGELEPRPNPGAPRRISMNVQLLGMVRDKRFARGVDEYPVLGDVVRLAVDGDFAEIFGSFVELAFDDDEAPKAFSMGRFAVDPDYEVYCLGKEFFSKHVAVMGNSGSGKSCTTAKIVHEALRLKHAQVVMFDMHGEYLASFSDENGKPDPNVTYLSDRNLVLPYWMLRYDEFEDVFLDQNNPLNINAQRVFLRAAFEKLKRPAAEALDLTRDYSVDTPIYYPIEQLKTYAENMNEARFVLGSQSYAFSRLPFRSLPTEQQEELLLSRRMEFNQGNPEGEVPHGTFHGRLLGLVNQLETRLNDRRYDFLLRPLEAAANNPLLRDYFRPELSPEALSRNVSWVIRQMLGQLDPRRNLTIVDLSGLPFNVVDITVSVLTRAIFDYNFWSPSESRHPVLMVFEEAHNYLPRDSRGRKTFARDAVEKVAKEGRKYGVAAMIVSQRPSEISETVLSQCNSMVLMRMNNPDDQDYAARVVSDQFRTLIDLLPGLRPGEGFVLGDSVLMPMRTLIEMPPRSPRSASLDFFGLWGLRTATCDVDSVIDRWWRQNRTQVNRHGESVSHDGANSGRRPSAGGGRGGASAPGPGARRSDAGRARGATTGFEPLAQIGDPPGLHEDHGAPRALADWSAAEAAEDGRAREERSSAHDASTSEPPAADESGPPAADPAERKQSAAKKLAALAALLGGEKPPKE
ncbi:MAG: ATP-binding protein, partial [Phycisphaerae bacterium]